MKRIAVWVVLIALLQSIIFPAYGLTSAEKENNYSAAILQLETYLENAGNSSAELAGIENAFRELGGYEQSRFLRYYVNVLMKIADEEYDGELNIVLDMLEANKDFQSYLEETLKGSSIGSVEKLKIYTIARKYEYQGQAEAAIQEYKKCLDFFGADERYMSLLQDQYETGYERARELLRNENYAGAYYEFLAVSSYSDSQQWMESIVKQLGYTPTSRTDNLEAVTGLKASEKADTEITISWEKARRASSYEVYYKKHSSSEWSNAGSTSDTKKKITGLKKERGTILRFWPSADKSWQKKRY